MRIKTSVLAGVLTAVVVAGAQQKPDFSGDWVLATDRSSQTMSGSVVVSVSGLLGDKFSAVQDAKALTLTITVAALGLDIKAVYNLDGSESKNMNPGSGGQPDEPIFSRASWEADKLVILTRGTALVNGKVTETKRVIWLDKDGLLTIDRIAEGAPTRRSVPATEVTSVSRKPLIAALALIAATSLLVFGWLAWRFYQQRQESQTVLIDRLTETGALIAREIGPQLDRWEAMAARADNLRGLPSGATLLVFGTSDVIAVRGESLAYYPALPKSEGRADGRLVRAQVAERAGDLDAALTGYRDAATSTARTPRALATAGLGRTLRAKGNTREALAAHDELAQMDEARIEGDPAPLVAYRERQAIFLALGDSASAERERARIESALRARLYIIDRETFDLFAPALGSAPYSPPLLARADVVTAELWPRWRATPSGRALAGRPDYAFASVWRPSTGESVAIVAPIDVLMEQAVTVASRLSTTIALENSDGRHIWGETPPTEGSATVTLSDIGLSARLRLWLTNR